MPSNRTTNIWSIWAGEEPESTESYDLGMGTTSVLWDNVADLSAATSERDVSRLVEQAMPGNPGNGNFTGSLWAFKARINTYDFVVMPMRGDKFSVGVVLGNYAYDRIGRQRAFHHRRAQWLYTHMPRAILPDDLRAAIAGRATVTALFPDRAPHAAARILAACAAHLASQRTLPA